MLTLEAKQRYLSYGGECCPFCESEAIVIGPILLEDPPHKSCTCQECHRYWEDILEVVVVDVIER